MTEIPAGWRPTSEAELKQAADDGLFEETHNIEIKREPGQGSSASKESARDMASFAIDGGLLIYGVDEDTTPPSCTPFDTSGQPERLESIARSRCHPPLAVTCSAIVSDEHPGKGYVIVNVPPSPLAPHMVEGRYYGRGDKTRIALDDGAVTELHRRRLEGQRSVTDLAATHLDMSPLSLRNVPSRGTLAVIARPRSALQPLLESLSHADNWAAKTLDLVRRAASSTEGVTSFAPHPRNATTPERRPNGIALVTGLQPGRWLQPAEADQARVVEIELDESGEIRLISARAADKKPESNYLLVFEKLVVEDTAIMVRLAGEVARQAHYYGVWEVAAYAQGLAGATSWELDDRLTSGPVYTANTYSRATTTTLDEIEAAPYAVAARLTLPLLRALGSERLDTWDHLHGPTPTRPASD